MKFVRNKLVFFYFQWAHVNLETDIFTLSNLLSHITLCALDNIQHKYTT